MAAIDTIIGNVGIDVVTLASTGMTVMVKALETLIGGVGADVVKLDAAGATMLITGIETLTGSKGTDVVTIGSGGVTMVVRGVETLRGGAGADTLTLIGGCDFLVGAGGGDTLTLDHSKGGAYQLAFSQPGAVGAGVASGFEQVTGFQTGVDNMVVAGALRGVIDRNGDGVVQGAMRATGALNLATDEVVGLTAKVASLTDGGFASVRAGIGGLAGSSVGASALVLASDGADTGLYLVSDANGDKQLGASEVSLLCLFKKTVNFGSGSNFLYG